MVQSQQTVSSALGTALNGAQLFALASCYLALWALIGRYYGLEHDATIYVMQALARLDPDVYLGDLYLKFGSQDDFTLFSSFSAIWIRWLGIDHGAAALTFTFLVLWYVAAWTVIRELLDRSFAWLAVGLLLAVPVWYGADHVFEITERFLSPRLPAQALCLLALVGMLRKSWGVAAACFALALVTHPLMTAPALAVAALLMVPVHRKAPSTVLVAAILCAAILLVGYILGGDAPIMAPDWLSAVRHRSRFLFMDTWKGSDWQSTLLPIVTLWLATRLSADDGSLNRFVQAALSVGIAGLAATAAVSWLVPVKFVIQAQPWRWTWVGAFLALVLLPWVLHKLWTAPTLARPTALALATAWLLTCSETDPVGPNAGLALTAAAPALTLLGPHLDSVTRRLLAVGMATALAGASAAVLLNVTAEAVGAFDVGSDPIWLERLVGAVEVPASAALLASGAWALVVMRPTSWTTSAVAAIGITLSMLASPGAWASWTTSHFDQIATSALAPWRQVIGRQQEVLWPDGLEWTWFALGRRSYLSLSQLSGIIFSAETLREARRRAAALSDVYPPGTWFHEDGDPWPPAGPSTSAGVIRVCSAEGVDYYVSKHDVGLEASRAEWPTKGMFMYLYDCKRLLGRTAE